MALLEINNVKKIYTSRLGTNKVQALDSVTFSVEKGEYVAIMGESGSGKTTLLNILASIDKPTSGQVLLDGKDLSKIKQSELAAFPEIIWVLFFRILTYWIPLHFRIIYFCLWYYQVTPIKK